MNTEDRLLTESKNTFELLLGKACLLPWAYSVMEFHLLTIFHHTADDQLFVRGLYAKRAIVYFLAAGEMTKHILCQGGIFLHHVNPHILLLPQTRRVQHTQP